MIDVSRETHDRLVRLQELVLAENHHQNLVAASTIADFWDRHIVDSLQLLQLAPPAGTWLDIGTGAGFPGLAVACAREGMTYLVEPRRLRADFLSRAAAALGMGDRVHVIASSIQATGCPPMNVISARAVASVSKLFDMAAHLATSETTWLLMKGAKARDELAEAQQTWQGEFRLVQSVTDPAASIVVATSVKRKGRR